MRFKINLDLDKINIKKIAEESARQVNKLLGNNNKWHDLQVKPYTCSLIKGGKKVDDDIVFNDIPAFFYINTEDSEVITKIMSNLSLEFEVVNVKLFSGFNLFSVKNVVYNKSGEKLFITEENKKDFISYVKSKYLVDIEILKLNNVLVSYKNGGKLPTTNLLIKCGGGKLVSNLLESGIGGSCSIGFGHVEPINSDKV